MFTLFNSDVKTKVDNLSQLRRYLSTIPNINTGGCGIAAIAMYKWLLQNKLAEQKDLSFIYLYKMQDQFYENNSLAINGMVDKATAAWHIIIRFKDKYFDTHCIYYKSDLGFIKGDNGTLFDELLNKIFVVNSECYRLYHEINDVNFLVNGLKNGGWNPEFDREKQIPIISKHLNLKFTEII